MEQGSSKDSSIHESLDQIVDAFEDAWNSDREVNVEEFLPPSGHPQHDEIVGELLCVDFERRHKLGESPSVDQYELRFAELLVPDVLQRLAFEEYRLRAAEGDQRDPLDYERRFGIATDSWVRLEKKSQNSGAVASKALADGVADEMSRIVAVTQPMPQAGEEFLSFSLLEQLGECKFGRVFIATQNDLSNRRVVLKVTSNLWAESDRLARLQHPNIVPIYSVHQSNGLQAVCMPFLGRQTLEAFVKQECSDGRFAQSSMVAIVDRWRDGLEDQTCVPDPHCQWLSSLTYEQFATWLIAKISAGLSHAHQRGILHRDLKPANVLVTNDLQPMILDFNLSDDVVSGGRSTLLIGGTLPYMAPEHLLAVISDGKVDERSDIYSLGVMLFELLTGELPFRTQRGSTISTLSYLISDRYDTEPAVRKRDPSLSVDIDSIVLRCLASNPADRYQSVSELQKDLESHLENRPLRFAANRSVRERTKKWCRRHPRLSSSSFVASVAALMLAAFAGLFAARSHEAAKLEAIDAYRDFMVEQQSASAPLSIAFNDRQVLQRGVTDATAALEIVGANDPEWKEESGYRLLDHHTQGSLRESVERLQFLVANANLRLAKMEVDNREHWLETADRYNRLSSQSNDRPKTPHALAQQRREIDMLGVEDFDEPTFALTSTEWMGGSDQELVAVQLLHQNKFAKAAAVLEPLADEQNEFLHWLMLGTCYAHMDQTINAEAAFSACIALLPGHFSGWQNRGVLRVMNGNDKEAECDFTKALEIWPDCESAILYRANVRLRLQKYREAIDDLNHAIENGRQDSIVYRLRSNAWRGLGDEKSARQDMQRAAQAEPIDEEGWIRRGLSKKGSDPDGAIHDFDLALRLNPSSRLALQNKAALLSVLRRNDEAVDALSQWIEMRPDDTAALIGRAILLARLGNREQAISDGHRALVVKSTPGHHYQMARVLANTSRIEPSDLETAAIHLRYAVAMDPTTCRLVERDPDIQSVLDVPGIQSVLDAATSLLKARGDKPNKTAEDVN